jgi:predicted Rossmann-fold nucleotide-binding protein
LGLQGSRDLILEKIEGRTVAYLNLIPGCLKYHSTIEGLLPTLAKALVTKQPVRELLKLHHKIELEHSHTVKEGELLLVRSLPLHIRTVFGRVVEDLLPTGFHHTTASILQPDTKASGDVYELYGTSSQDLPDLPLEFYTLESFREYIFFEDRDQLQTCLEDDHILFNAFNTAPEDRSLNVATFVTKGKDLLALESKNWTIRETHSRQFPGISQGQRQGALVTRYIEEQPSYPYLLGIDDDLITSQGILLTRYFPSPFMKRMLLSNQVQNRLKGLYFQYPSQSSDGFFSSEDRALLHDLYKFGLPVFWVDPLSKKILQYVEKSGKDTGLFVPKELMKTFLNATLFGIYGSNLLGDHFEEEILHLLQGVLDLKNETTHTLLNTKSSLALVTGGGPGAMAVGNRVAKKLNILSCANIVDFRSGLDTAIIEQKQNPYIDAKMTYRIDKLVERQAEFNLDFPIFLHGGIGTDFEFCLEEVRRKVAASNPTPILLFGDLAFWQKKITPRFQCNRESGTTKGSEWLSNCVYYVKNAQEGLDVYKKFFDGVLEIGPSGPIYDAGFFIFY